MQSEGLALRPAEAVDHLGRPCHLWPSRRRGAADDPQILDLLISMVMRFKSRPEARDWCKAHYPGSPITEIGPKGRAPSKSQGMTLSPDDPLAKGVPKGRPRKAE